LFEEKEKYKNVIENTILKYEKNKQQILKIFCEKLRLSEKFVKTSQF
jgi:hypothetical protein